MKKILTLLMIGAIALAGLAMTGCVTTPNADPLTTIISLETTGGAKAYVQSPKDTLLESLTFDAQTGSVTVSGFATSATDPTNAYMGVLAAQGAAQAEQTRLITEMLSRLAGGGSAAPQVGVDLTGDDLRQ